MSVLGYFFWGLLCGTIFVLGTLWAFEHPILPGEWYEQILGWVCVFIFVEVWNTCYRKKNYIEIETDGRQRK